MNMKKLVSTAFLLLSAGFVWSLGTGIPGQPPQGRQSMAAPQKSTEQSQLLIKSYSLKNIKPEEILRAAKFYYEDATFVDNVVTVKIWSFQVAKFEEVLNKLDVEKKTVQFQVFAIIASRKPVEERILKGTGEGAEAGPGKTVTPPSPRPKTKAQGEKPPAGETVSLKFKEAQLRDVVLYLAEVARLNVVFDAAVQGVVTCNLQDIPWERALDIVLSQNRMEMVIGGNVLWVAPAGRVGDVRSSISHTTLENRDLKKVLDELNTLWNFTSYEVDGPSFLTIRESSGANSYTLVTNRPLNLLVSNVRVSGEEAGKRTISIEQLKLSGMANFVDYVFIDTHEVVMKEKGYLVAGVSGYGSSSQRALILVINGEIK